MSAPWRRWATCGWRSPTTAYRSSMLVTRRGMRSGHMPGAFNVPFDQLIENGTLVSRERIAQTFTDAGVDLKKPIITSCGSGMTAAILTFALESIGTTATGLYDGSWTEWGSRPDTPVERE